MLYRAVAQLVLMFGSETRVLLAAMERKVEGTHTCFLQCIMWKQTQRLDDGTWEMASVEVVQEAAGMMSLMSYICRGQANVAQWVSL